jgi:hypothetical protein
MEAERGGVRLVGGLVLKVGFWGWVRVKNWFYSWRIVKSLGWFRGIGFGWIDWPIRLIGQSD